METNQLPADGRPPGPARALLVAAAAWLAAAIAGPAAAQEQARPSILPGHQALLVPVQTAAPTAGGGWPGGASSRARTLETLNAELDFALQEVARGPGWISPGEVSRRAEKNPLAKVDPHRLSYGVLLSEELEVGDRVTDPLHGQIRRLSALTDKRVVVVPVALRYVRLPADSLLRIRGASEQDSGTVRADSSTGPNAAAAGGPRGRAVLEMAVVDARTGRLVWRGGLRGELAEPDDPGLLARLAGRVVELLVPS